MPRGVNPGHGQNRSRGSPSPKSFFSDRKATAMLTIWEEMLLFLVSFGIQIFDAFLASFWT